MSWFWPDFVELTTAEADWILNGSLGIVKLAERTIPAPISGVGQLYTKSDHNLYYQNSLGVEIQLGSGGGGGAITSITGTANQVIVSSLTGAVTLSLPQSIATISTPQFIRLGIGVAADAINLLTFTQAVASSGNPSALVLTGGAHTNLTLSTEAIGVNFNLAQIVQFATGALATQRAMLIQAPTYGFVGASTITTAATLAISGAPVTGTNATITNSFALWVQGGDTLLGKATPTTAGAFIHRPSASTPYFGIYDSGNSKVYGIAVSLGSLPAGFAGLGGYYGGMGVQGTTNGGTNPMFGVLTSTQSGNGLGNTAFTVQDGNQVYTINNTLDDGSGNSIIVNQLTVGKVSSQTGAIFIKGTTSGSLEITTAAATAQAIILTVAAQTVGGATLTIPNMANVSKTLAWLESPSFTTPALGAATATSINGLIVTSTLGTLTIANNASAVLVTSGNFSLTLTTTAATIATFPSGTITLVATTVTTLSSLVSIGTITTGGLGTGATIAGVTMSLGSDAVGDIYAATTSNVLSRIAAVATGQVLISKGTTTLPAWSASATLSNLICSNNAVTASGNAATVPVTSRLTTVTNNSAATLTITITTTNAVDGQLVMVRILDATAVAQTITWVNTENSTVTAPTTSNGSTTLFLTVGFIYNGGTSKWRCIASA